jgi:hypothetical protein
MITQTFTVKEHRFDELQTFIKNEMPTFRYKGNPTKLHDILLITCTYEVDDIGKLSQLQSKWYLEDNPIETPKPSFFKRLKTWILTKL